MSPLLPDTPYEAYVEKEVVISKFDHSIYVPKTASYDYIVTEDGEKYNITGDYNRSELSEKLTTGTVATIKYAINKILPFKKYAEEIIVDGNKIVTYNNDAPTDWSPLIIVSSCFFLIGVFLSFVVRWHVKGNRKRQAKRDARIIKKYGKLKK